MYHRLNAEYVTKPPGSCMSTKGCGARGPDRHGALHTPEGVTVPTGPIIQYEIPSLTTFPPDMTNEYISQQVRAGTYKNSYVLQHNEYIVYQQGRDLIKTSHHTNNHSQTSD